MRFSEIEMSFLQRAGICVERDRFLLLPDRVILLDYAPEDFLSGKVVVDDGGKVRLFVSKSSAPEREREEKLGKFLARFVGMSDADISNLVNEVMSAAGKKAYSVEFLYLESGYDTTTIGSCMAGQPELFSGLPSCEGQTRPGNTCCLLSVLRGERQVARAILWEAEMLQGIPEGCGGLIDRIYCAEPAAGEYIKEWATENGFAYLGSQAPGGGLRSGFYVFDHEEWDIDTLLLVFDPRGSKLVPYMDTFNIFSPEEGGMVVGHRKEERALSNTDGYNPVYDESYDFDVNATGGYFFVGKADKDDLIALDYERLEAQLLRS
jgi:hypothetical protein